jgi:hypothetical protein
VRKLQILDAQVPPLGGERVEQRPKAGEWHQV